jgi:hypothetical protein
MTRTFAEARAEYMQYLESKGWVMSPRHLVTPHVTSPSGATRFWFKPQSVLFTRSPLHHHAQGNARSMHHADIRQLTAEKWFAYAMHYCVEKGAEP